MGLFSKLFGKKEEPEKESEIIVTSKAQIRVEDGIPEFQGDYAKSVFLWSQRKAGPIQKSNIYPQYIKYECGISDPFEYHKELLAGGYFEAATLPDMLKSLKAAEIKEILKELQLPVSGKKEALIERVPDTLDDEILKKYFPFPLYSLSEMGEHFLLEHNDCVQIHTHKNWEITWDEYKKRCTPNRSFYDTVWGIFNERLTKAPHDFGSNTYYAMYQLLEEEGKKGQALEMLLRVLYIDVSGVGVVQQVSMYRSGYSTKKELLEDFDVYVMLAPGIISSIARYKDEFDENMVEHIYTHELPLQICSKKQFVGIIHSAIEGTFDLEKETKKLKTEYNKYIRSL